MGKKYSLLRKKKKRKKGSSDPTINENELKSSNRSLKGDTANKLTLELTSRHNKSKYKPSAFIIKSTFYFPAESRVHKVESFKIS